MQSGNEPAPVPRRPCDVLIISRYSPLSGKGVENVVLRQIESLTANGYSVKVLYRKRRGDPEPGSSAGVLTIPETIPFVTGTLADLVYLIPTYLLAARSGSKVIMDNLDYPVVLRAMAGILRRPVKIIKVHHGTPDFLGSYTGIRSIQARAYGLLLGPACSLSCRCTDLDIAVSSKVRGELISRYGAAPEKVVVLRNAVDASVFRPRDRASSRKLLGLPLERKLVLFVGGDAERKGMADALAVVKNLRRTHPGAMLVALTPKLPKGNPDHVIHLPSIPSGRLPFLYNASDLLILPSRYEAGVPLSVLEAMASGIPCIVSSQCAEPESGGLYVADSPDAMLAPCQELLLDKGLWSRASSASRSTALAFFDARRKKGDYARTLSRFAHPGDGRRR